MGVTKEFSYWMTICQLSFRARSSRFLSRGRRHERRRSSPFQGLFRGHDGRVLMKPFWMSAANFIAWKRLWLLLLAGPSDPIRTVIPAASISGSAGSPKRDRDCCRDCARLWCCGAGGRLSFGLQWTQWTASTSGPRKPMSLRNSVSSAVTRSCGLPIRNGLGDVGCNQRMLLVGQRPRSAQALSSTVQIMQGATPIWTRPPGRLWRRTSARASARANSGTSISSAGTPYS